MSEEKHAQHTPGPWHYFKTERHGESGNKHADLFVIESDSRKSMATLEVWELNHDPKWRAEHQAIIEERKQTMKEVEANARLIAAAPELLDALKDAEAWIKEVIGMNAEANHLRNLFLDQSRAAIAKAEGK